MYLRTCGSLCPQITKKFGQSVTFAECPQSNKPVKSANLRKLFADRPPLLSSHPCEKTQKEGLFFSLFFAKKSRKDNVFSGLSLLSLTGRNVT
jgi:hypothetical protein